MQVLKNISIASKREPLAHNTALTPLLFALFGKNESPKSLSGFVTQGRVGAAAAGAGGNCF